MHHPDSIILSVKSLGNHLKRLMAAQHSPHHSTLTGMQHAVIGYVGNSDQDVFQRDIERHFNIRRSTATGILQLMEKNGLIQREPVDHDLRLKRIVLTEEALAIHREADARLAELEGNITSGLSPGEIDAFFCIIDKITGNIKAALTETECPHQNSDNPEDTL